MKFEEKELQGKIAEMLKDFEKMKWITINENIRVEVIAGVIIEKILELPHKLFREIFY